MKEWLEATRPRTLPVSCAGVIAGTACALLHGAFAWPQALICLLFALIAQIVSNFANEYYDFKNGLDRKGREGFRRGVTEGDIRPETMKHAMFALLALDCLLGCSLIYWGGWWLIPVGVAIAVFALAYSTGPWPLSHHGLGDVAVIIFFGIVPVWFTAWLQAGSMAVSDDALKMGVGVGLLAANVLIVNNYRDMEDDRAVGKHTTVVLLGRRVMSTVYLIFGLVGVGLVMWVFWPVLPKAAVFAAAFFAAVYIDLWWKITHRKGKQLNPLLGKTALTLMAVTICTLILALI